MRTKTKTTTEKARNSKLLVLVQVQYLYYSCSVVCTSSAIIWWKMRLKVVFSAGLEWAVNKDIRNGCLYLVPIECVTVGDLLASLLHYFNLIDKWQVLVAASCLIFDSTEGAILSVEGFTVPSSSPLEILRDNDIIK